MALLWTAWLVAAPARGPAWRVVVSGAPLLMLASWAAYRASGTRLRWGPFVRQHADAHALAGVLLWALGVQYADTHGITTDGVIYFSQLRSALFDRDLDVAAEFAYLGQPPRPSHLVPIGPTLVWLPLYAAVALVDALGRAAGAWSAPADPVGLGLTLPYVRAALLSSFAIGAAGLAVLHRHLRTEWGPHAALLTSLLIVTATPLVWYMVYEPSMTHAASFGFVAMFVVCSWRFVGEGLTPRRSMLLGLLLGLAFATRPQEALFALFPAVLVLTSANPIGDRLRAAARLAGWALLGALPLLAAQAAHAATLFSRESFALVGAGGYLDLGQPRWADTLWSSWHGFLSWSPVAYLAVIGTIWYLGRQWRWAAASLAILFLMAWVNGSTADWAAGWSFGGRRFTSCLAILAPGLALLVAQLLRRPVIALVLVLGAIVAWNQALMIQFAEGQLRASEPTGFAQVVRQQAAVVTRPPFFYPFAFPANVWFAWRTGLGIDRYDLLGPETPQAAIDLTFDEGASRYLLTGWGARVADGWGPLRWTDGPRAEIVLPFDAGTDPGTLEITARTRLLDPPQSARLAAIVNGQEVGRLSPDAHQPSSHVLTIPPHVLIRGFNRLVLAADAGPDGQPTPPVGVYRLTLK